MRVYLDHNATTPVHRRLCEELPRLLETWGNPSSIHWAGREAKVILRETRTGLAVGLGCHPLEIVFTSGGSEGNNTILRGVFEKLHPVRNHFLCSSVEHPSVMRTFEYLQSRGAVVDWIPISKDGVIDLEFIKAHLTEKTALVSVMLANNETGHIFPIQEIVKMAEAKGALVHTDAVQGLGKIPVNLHSLGVHYATFSAHKFYALKGSGFVFIKRGAPFEPLILGGGQERHRRGGTENVLGIAALGVMAPLLSDVESQAERIRRLRDEFESRVLKEIPNVRVTGAGNLRVPNTSSLILDGVDGETLLMSLDLKGFAVSTGAACSSGNPEPSPVLLAMGLSRSEAQNSLRVSFGWDSSSEEVEAFIKNLKQIVLRLRALRSEALEVIHV